MTSPRFRRKRPRFNGSPSDHDDTQYFTRLRTDEADGTTWPAEPGHVTFGGVSDIGVMAIAIGPAPLAIGPAPLDGYQPAPAAFPALPAPPAPEPLPDWERDLLDEEARQMALPVLRDVPVTERAAIGDELRLPVIWCEMPSCISWHHDPASAGFGDSRRRAIADGWRYDALGLLACPPCQQTRPDYRTPQPVAWHHPDVATHWHERGTVLRDEDAFRLGVEAELGRRVSYEDPALASAVAGATFRHHRAVTA